MTNDNGTAPFEAPIVFNGWSIYAHPIFLDQLDGLIKEVIAQGTSDLSCTRSPG